MKKLGNTTFDDSVKKVTFAAFKKMYEPNSAFMFDLGQLGLSLEDAYIKLTGNAAKEPDDKKPSNVKDKAEK